MPQSDGGGSARELRQHSTPRLPSASDASTLPNTGAPSTTPSVPESTRGRTLTYEDLSRCFHLPINAAAKELGVCVTALKKQCRKHGVPRWPHRKLKSLDKLKEKLEKEEATAADKEYYKHEIHSITQKKDHIFRSNSANAAAAAAAAAAAGSRNAHGNVASAPLPHLLGGSAGTPLHARAGPQLMMGHPMAHYPAFQIAQNPLSAHHAQPTSREDAAKLVQGQHVQQPPTHGQQPQQRIITGPMVMPIAQLPGGAPAAIAAPNGALIPQPIHGVQPFPHWGVYDPNNAAASNPPVAMPSMHFYNPAAYAYAHAPTMNGLGPYQNMVQVNVMEQPAYGVAARDPNQPTAPIPPSGGPPKKEANSMTAPAAPSSNGGVVGVATRSDTGGKAQENSKPEIKPGAPTSNPGYDMYGNMAHGASPAPGQVMYSIMPPHNMHYEGMGPHQNSATPVHGPVPAYWTEIQHTQTPSNMVTMCNQTVHHHHHHGTETASPSLGQKDPAKRLEQQQQDNASVRTNNSERAATSKGKEAQSAAEPQITTVTQAQVSSKPIPQLNATTSAQPRTAVATATTTTTTTTSPRNGDSIRPKSVSSQTQSDSKCANSSGVGTNGYHPSSGMANGVKKTTVSQDALEETSYSSRSNENDKSGDGSPRRPNKRARTQPSSSVPGDTGVSSATREENGSHSVKPSNVGVFGSGTGDGGSETASKALAVEQEDGKSSIGRKWVSNVGVVLPNGKAAQGMGSLSGMGTGSIKDASGPGASASVSGGGGGGGTTANTVNRARRYDHVVHQCLALASAQWCTDLNFKVTLALGPKLMLSLAGVPSLGKSVLDGTDNAIEDSSTTRNKYLMATKGQRLEWVATNGNNRYLMIMNPYRKRNSAEISGVSGLMVELKIVQALSS